MEQRRKDSLIKLFIYLYFVVAIIELIGDYFSVQFLIFIPKLVFPVLLLGAYYYKTSKRNILFFLMLFFSVVSNLFYFQNTQKALFYTIIFYSVQKVIQLIIILKIIKIKDYIPLVLATIPFAIIFFYLFFAKEVPQNSYFILVFINCIGALLGGVAVSTYVMNDTKQTSLLMISVLLVIGVQMSAYIERYYFVEEHSDILRPLEIVLRTFALYAFYEFLLVSEKLNDN